MITEAERLLLERIKTLESRLGALERREHGSGVGDMLKSVYDTDDDGKVNEAEAVALAGVSGHDKAAHDALGLDHGSLSGKSDDDHTQYLLANGTRGLSADWDAGDVEIRAKTLEADVATGTAPMTIASTTVVTNLNADQLDGNHASAFATSAQGVTNGDSHDHSGGDGAQIDHGGLAGLSDDDHPAYMIYPCQGRLTLESGVAVSTTDQSAKTTLYFTPFSGNKLALYLASNVWAVRTFTQISVTLSGITAGLPYDVFCYDNSGTPTLTLLAWTNTTTRATALGTQDGVLIKNGYPTQRYLGTICANSSGGQTDDTVTKRLVWNYYNRRFRNLLVVNSSSHSYNGALRKWNNSDTNNLIEYVVGVAENSLAFSYRGGHYAGADGNYATIALYHDGAEVNTYYRIGNLNAYSVVGGVAVFIPPGNVGYHYAQVYETGNHAGSTFSNMMLSGNILG